MMVEMSNVLKVFGWDDEFLEWCKENYSFANPEYANKLRMGKWLGNTPKYLRVYEQVGEAIILPFGTIRRVYKRYPNAKYISSFIIQPNIDYGGEAMKLYPYQENAVNTVFSKKYGILQAPPGSGKTQMGIALIKKWSERALWLTHTLDLLNQSKERAERYIDKSLIGTITGGEVHVGNGITFATIQTMAKLDLSQMKDYWGVIIVDECHRAAGTPTALTQFSKVLNTLSAKHKYGLSATVHRSDGLIESTYALLGDVVYEVPQSEVENTTMRVGIKTISTNVPIGSECLNWDGTLNYAKLINYLCENEDRNQTIIDNIEYGKPSLILSDRLEQLSSLMAMLPDDERAKAVMVNGKMTTKKGKADRAKAMEDMRTGEKKYLFASYSLAKEGLDIPCLERLYMATPVKDYAIVTQSIGRIARTANGKSEPICYDFVDDIGFLVRMYKKRCTSYRKARCYFVD